MDDKIMLNNEELNRVSGGNYEDYYRERIAENREEVDYIRDQLCPCCRMSIRRLDKGKFACKNCWILWKLP